MIAGAAALAVAAGAQASVTNPFIHVHAANAQGAGDLLIPVSDATFNPGDGSYLFFLPAPVAIMSGPNVIATVNQMTSVVRPAGGGLPNLVSFGFAVQSGASDTTFTMDTTTLIFDGGPLFGSQGRASAGIGVSDQNGDGVLFHELNPAHGAYLTSFDELNPGNPPPGIPFAALLHGAVANPNGNGSANANDANPGGGNYTPLPAVFNMHAQWEFVLSAQDTAGGTSNWEVIPSPGAMSLLGLGGLVAIRRSRR
jgi:MYXO-CTERM domain-containing protein